jgi:hypothetical protein
MSDNTEDRAPSWLERERVISLTEAERLTTLSEDTLKRVHADKIIRLSPRRLGMKLRSVLAIASGTATKTA